MTNPSSILGKPWGLPALLPVKVQLNKRTASITTMEMGKGKLASMSLNAKIPEKTTFQKMFALLKDCQEIGFYIGVDSNSITVSECRARHCP